MAELEGLDTMAMDSEEGRLTRELTEPEVAALKAYNAAMELECERAGFRSLAEFERWDARQRRLRP